MGTNCRRNQGGQRSEKGVRCLEHEGTELWQGCLGFLKFSSTVWANHYIVEIIKADLKLLSAVRALDLYDIQIIHEIINAIKFNFSHTITPSLRQNSTTPAGRGQGRKEAIL